jgi:hypothetical protein
MCRILLLFVFAGSLAAQGFHKDLTKQKFNLRASTSLPKKVILNAPPKACSIPLTRIQPPSKNGTITVIRPKASKLMPNVHLPAPICK